MLMTGLSHSMAPKPYWSFTQYEHRKSKKQHQHDVYIISCHGHKAPPRLLLIESKRSKMKAWKELGQEDKSTSWIHWFQLQRLTLQKHLYFKKKTLKVYGVIWSSVFYSSKYWRDSCTVSAPSALMQSHWLKWKQQKGQKQIISPQIKRFTVQTMRSLTSGPKQTNQPTLWMNP